MKKYSSSKKSLKNLLKNLKKGEEIIAFYGDIQESRGTYKFLKVNLPNITTYFAPHF